jgi:hypothetical protein
MVKAALRPRVPEKTEQAHIVQLLRSIGGAVYVLGTRRPSGDFQGTRQTPGIGDIFALLPKPPLPAPTGEGKACGVWIEVKASGGRLRTEQAAFRDQCIAAAVPHVVGGLNQVIEFLIAGGWLKAENVPHYRTHGD